MPIGYLVTSGIVAGSTFVAVRPLKRPHAAAMLSLMLAMIVNELPFLVFCFLLVSSVGAIAQSGAGSAVGWVAYGLSILATVGLVVIVRRARRTRPVIERALTDGLGDGWRTTVDAELISQLGTSVSWLRTRMAPFLVRRRDVEHSRNISFGDAGRDNLLDVYRHRSHPSGGPVLIHLHGGSFAGSRKDREARPLLYRLASQGWVCVSANYRLLPAARFPDQLVDVKRVIAWVRAHGHEYGADPSQVFVSGSSAGAHLAAMAALTANNPVLQTGFEAADTSVTAAITLYGYYGALDTDSDLAASPMAHTGHDAPPFFVAHGDLDTRVPVQAARDFVDQLRNGSSHPVVYSELPGAQHTFDLFHSIRFQSVIAGIEAFSASVRTRAGVQR